ncbi:MAG: L,D-transpeptidase [Verrucomicrobia bacterium]|nr:L,D-transpeptidase [Verrucomicrobiota bacterium]
MKLLFRNARCTLLLGVVMSAQVVAGANLNMATSHASRFGAGQDHYLVVSISEQKLLLMRESTPVRTYIVSTSKFGIGSESGSNKTPLGMHKICFKTGEGVPVGGIFKARQFTGSTATIHTDETDVPQDLITSRIMWLEGLEPGLNKGDGIDSYKRYIYIHGTNEEGLIGHPSSHGCVRMKNQEVVELYSLVSQGTLVYIQH